MRAFRFMTFDFINPIMLVGLAGVLIPVLVHLLRTQKHDVVEWGAIQFLELERVTRRRIRLEELLLLLLRMSLIALLTIAMARPWIDAGAMASFRSASYASITFAWISARNPEVIGCAMSRWSLVIPSGSTGAPLALGRRLPHSLQCLARR